MSATGQMTLSDFERCRAGHCKPWQLSDFRQHCVDERVARKRFSLFEWLRMFRGFTADDASMFDADGTGEFEATR